MSCCGDRKSLRRRHSVQEIESHAFLPHILDGYPCVKTINECLYSLFWVHNETVNCWSHLLGFAVMAGLFIWTGLEMHKHHYMDNIVWATFFVCACVCFLLSTCYHMFKLHSEAAYNVVVTLDYVGIFVMIFGSFFSGLYFEFYCLHMERVIYQSGIAALCIAGAILTFSPYFREPKFDAMRIGSYFVTVAFAAFPIAHAILAFGAHKVVKWLVLLGLYLSGAFFYITKWPESKYPGRFDIFFSSHQLWHIFVLLAALWHYYCLASLHQEVMSPGFCQNVADMATHIQDAMKSHHAGARDL